MWLLSYGFEHAADLCLGGNDEILPLCCPGREMGQSSLNPHFS